MGAVVETLAGELVLLVNTGWKPGEWVLLVNTGWKPGEWVLLVDGVLAGGRVNGVNKAVGRRTGEWVNICFVFWGGWGGQEQRERVSERRKGQVDDGEGGDMRRGRGMEIAKWEED